MQSEVEPDARRRAWEHRTSSALAVLGVLFVAVYTAFVLVTDPAPWLAVVIGVGALTTWTAFVIDMVARIALTERGGRWRFVLTHPIDVLSVFFPLFRLLRVASMLKNIPLLRGRSGAAVRGSVVAHAIIYAVVFVYAIALTTLQFERHAPGSTITTFGDALWWSIVTITTVGYGDTYPVTAVGRVLAATLMAGGIVIVGTTSAIVVSYITERVAVNRATATDDDQPPSSASSAS